MGIGRLPSSAKRWLRRFGRGFEETHRQGAEILERSGRFRLDPIHEDFRPMDEIFRENMRTGELRIAQDEALNALIQRYGEGFVSAPAVRGRIARAYNDAFRRQDEHFRNDAGRLYEGTEGLTQEALQEIQADLDAGRLRFREMGDGWFRRSASLQRPQQSGGGIAPQRGPYGSPALPPRHGGFDPRSSPGWLAAALYQPPRAPHGRPTPAGMPVPHGGHYGARHNGRRHPTILDPFLQGVTPGQAGRVRGFNGGLLGVVANGGTGYPSRRGR